MRDSILISAPGYPSLTSMQNVTCMYLHVYPGLERVFAAGEDSFGILCHPEGQTVVKMFDIDLEASHDAYTISGTFIKHLVSPPRRSCNIFS